MLGPMGGWKEDPAGVSLEAHSMGQFLGLQSQVAHLEGAWVHLPLGPTGPRPRQCHSSRPMKVFFIYLFFNQKRAMWPDTVVRTYNPSNSGG